MTFLSFARPLSQKCANNLWGAPICSHIVLFKRRAYFTLIEILLSMALFALVIGAVAFNIRYIVGQQKFQNEVSVVADILNRAQQLLLIYDKPMRVKFNVVENGIDCRIESDCLLDSVWEKWVTQRSKTLTQIHSVNFKDLNHAEENAKERTIYFFPKGGGYSKGVIELSSAKSSDIKGSYNAYICLPGYPMVVKALPESPENCFNNIDPQIGFIVKNEVIERAVSFE